MKVLFYAFFIILIACVVGCSTYTTEDDETRPPYDATITDNQALDIAEATFRYQFEHNVSGKNQKTYYLLLFGKDPSPEFLARFKDNQPPVRKGSDFTEGEIKFKVVDIERISDTKVKVYGGYYEGNVSASGSNYNVELKDGKWIVTGEDLLGVS